MPKTIFGTTEKSNFILNMKDDTIEKLPLICVKLCAIIMLIGQAIPDLVEVICILTGNGMGKSYGFLNTPYICLAITWVASIIMLVIMGARNRFEKKHHAKLVSIMVLLIVWAIISTMQSFSFLDAFNGLYGRTTGLLTIIACLMILLLMSFNNSEKNLKEMVKVLVITSAIQCGIGLLQILLCVINVPVPYESATIHSIPLYSYENLNNISLYGVCLPSGFSGSPIFFAEYLGLMLGITLILSCFEKSKFYTIMSMIYTYLMLDTHTVVGVIGTISILLATSIIMAIKKNKNILPIMLCLIVGIVTVSISFGLDGSYIFYDGAIIWQDSFYRLGTTGQYNISSAEFDIHNVVEVFSYIWEKTLSYIKMFPFVGTGADCLIYAQLGTADSITFVLNGFDLAYNDYLHIAVTLGIPALIIYLIGLIFCFSKMVKRFNDSNIFKGLLVSMIAFCIMGFFGNNSITVMPYIAMIVGLGCSKSFKTVEVKSTEPIDNTSKNN